MAWGYEKCFTIEHDTTVKRKIDCKDCIYYDKSDKSCLKRPLYLPEDGYNSWRTCKYFELNEAVSHYSEKNEQYTAVLKRRAIEEQRKEKDKKKVVENKAVININKKESVDKTSKKEVKNTYEIGKGYRIIEYIGKFPKTTKLEWQLLNVTMSNGKQKKINIGFDRINRLAYVDKNMYTKEVRECVRRRIQ